MTPRNILLLAAVFLANAVVLSVEMLATRLLFPHFGNTVFVWAAVISVIILGLFLGYMGGGLATNRYRHLTQLIAVELAGSGALVILIPWLANVLLLNPGTLNRQFPPFVSMFIVFGIPAGLAVSICPAVVGVLTSGRVPPAVAAGVVSALSAIGSVIGILVTTFHLVPTYGVRGVLIGEGLLLGGVGLAVAVGSGVKGIIRLGLPALLYGVFILKAIAATRASPQVTIVDPIYSKHSAYQLVRVFDVPKGGRVARLLVLDTTQEGGIYLDTRDVALRYMESYKLFLKALGGSAFSGNILFVGGGAHAMPLNLAKAMPLATIEVAEIDPVVQQVADRFFLANEARNLKKVLADGRIFLATKKRAYDGIYIDAFRGVSAVPFHLVTRELFMEAKDTLTSDGILASHITGNVAESDGLACRVAQTASSVFEWLEVYVLDGSRPGIQEVLLVMGKRAAKPAALLGGTGFRGPIGLDRLGCAPAPLFTDDFAPVEWLISRYQKGPK